MPFVMRSACGRGWRRRRRAKPSSVKNRTWNRTERISTLRRLLTERIVLLDGGDGHHDSAATSSTEADYRGERFHDFGRAI